MFLKSIVPNEEFFFWLKAEKTLTSFFFTLCWVQNGPWGWSIFLVHGGLPPHPHPACMITVLFLFYLFLKASKRFLFLYLFFRYLLIFWKMGDQILLSGSFNKSPQYHLLSIWLAAKSIAEYQRLWGQNSIKSQSLIQLEAERNFGLIVLKSSFFSFWSHPEFELSGSER